MCKYELSFTLNDGKHGATFNCVVVIASRVAGTSVGISLATGQQSPIRHQLRRCLRRFVGRPRDRSPSLFAFDVQG